MADCLDMNLAFIFEHRVGDAIIAHAYCPYGEVTLELLGAAGKRPIGKGTQAIENSQLRFFRQFVDLASGMIRK